MNELERVLIRLHNEHGGGWVDDHSACGIDCAWHESRLLLEARGLWPARQFAPASVSSEVSTDPAKRQNRAQED